MTEETREKKVVGRTVAVVLGIVCIILSAGLVATLALYLPAANSINEMKSDIAEKDSIINSQNATIISQTQQINALQNALQQTTTKDEEITYLQDYVSQLLNVLYMNASATLLREQPVQLAANENMSIWSDYLTYSGYVTVMVQSNSNTTYVQVVYSTYGIDYDEVKVVGTSGTASFPVLPTEIIEIRLGNTNAQESVSATVTAMYYF